ncbi:MAG: glycosyltransferase [Cyclobacteriaceae bacterium]
MMDNKVMQTRKRIAVFGRGAHTIPSYRALLNELSKSFDMVVYSEFPIKEKFNVCYPIRSVPFESIHRWLIIGWFLLRFGLDHLRKPFSMIHSHSTYPSGKVALLLKKIWGLPMVVCLDGAEAISIPSISFGDLIKPRKRRINEKAIRGADVVTVLTGFQAKGVFSAYPRKQIEIIPRGIDASVIKFKRPNYFGSRPITFLHVGYLHPVKDPIMLIDCFHLLTKSVSCRLIQVGQDYMNGEVQRHAAALGIAHLIEFKGFVEHDSICQYYEAADVLLHTSLFESQAIVVNEALAHGLLVFGTHVGLLADLAEKCCITVPTGEYQVLAKKVIKTLSDKDCCERLLEKSKEWIAQHDLAWTTNRYKDLYIDVIERSARSK